MTLQRPALARGTLDRAAHRRSDPGLIDRLLADPATAVLVLSGDQAPVVAGTGDALVLLDPATARTLAEQHRAMVAGQGSPGSAPGLGSPDSVTDLLLYLGEDVGGRAHLAWPLPAQGHQQGAASSPPVPSGPDGALPPAPEGTRWEGLRAVGALLDDSHAGLLTTAVALAQWHALHPRCARCGAPTEVAQAGWSRRCPRCTAEHFPRTDPAVIMAISDPDDRILLGRQARWPEGRFSTLAGFVEPGESLEEAVRREVLEEAGVEVAEVEYLGSQPWPFPSSLMLGFRGSARTTRIEVDGAELAQARWWSRSELAADVAEGRLLLPPGLSIARRLIEHWFGGPITDVVEAWR